MTNQFPLSPSPLTVNELIACFRFKWGVSYDLRLVVRKNRLFLQIMWGYLEQQSFPMTEIEYKNHLNETVEIINRIGQADLVREWIDNLQSRPRIGRALSLQLKEDERQKEFLL